MAAFSFTNLEISLPNSLFQILFESGAGVLGASDTGRSDVLVWQAETLEHVFPHDLGDEP